MPLYQPPPPQPVVSRTGAQPLAPDKVAAISFVAAPVNDPPFTHPGRLALLDPIIWSWQPLPPLPILPRYYPQEFVQPPQQDQPYRRDWETGILRAWQPQNLLPTLPRYYPHIAIQVDSPPGFIQQVPIWHALDPLPQRGAFYPQVAEVVVEQVPYARPWLAGIIQAWQPFDPLPMLGEKLAPPSVDNPPFGKANWVMLADDIERLPTLPPKYPQPFVQVQQDQPSRRDWLVAILAAWLGADPAIVRQRLLNPGIPGMSVDNPPGLLRVQQPSFEPVTLPILPVRARIQGVDVNDPPFDRRHLEEFLRQWQPPDPLPTLPRWLAAALLGVAVNDPPFSHLGRKEIDSILAMWRDPNWALWWTMRAPPQVQPGPPLVVSERFTVSGPTVQDLFFPIGDVSHDWSGGTQKRTV